MKVKKVLFTSALIIWMTIIFLFSNQTADKSSGTSDKVTECIITFVTKITKKDITYEQRTIIINNTSFLVRKTAHFVIYFILGIIAYLTFISYNLSKPLIYSIVFCFIYACSDEFHQLFLDGRTFKLMDILIDTSGIIIGSNFIYLIKKQLKK